MDKKVESRYLLIIYFSLAAALLYNGLHAGAMLWMLMLLAGLLALSITVRHILLYADGKCLGYRWLFFLIDIMLAFLIGLMVNPDYAAVFYLIILCDALIACSKPAGFGIAGLCFTTYLLCKVWKTAGRPVTELLSGISLAAGAFIATVALMTIVRYEMETRQSHDEMLYQLKTKSKQLEEAYQQLKEAARIQEEVTVLRERTRIAREMHDTVGHALTTGLISLEAGERMAGDGNGLAAEKISLAKGQIRKGLAGLRQAVLMLGSTDKEMEFLPSIRILLEDTRKQGISIHEELSALPKLSKQQETALYRALQEGLTNGLKHGGSTAFVFRLKQEGSNVTFMLEDNGKGCDKIVPGFGLTAMAQRIGSIGGSFSICSEPGQGCRIDIILPMED